MRLKCFRFPVRAQSAICAFSASSLRQPRFGSLTTCLTVAANACPITHLPQAANRAILLRKFGTVSLGSTLREQVLHEIEHKHVVIFGESHCLACLSASKKFEKLGVEPIAFHLDLGAPQVVADMKLLLRELTGETSLPLVFVAGKYMSGAQAVATKLQDAKAVVGKQALRLQVMQEIELNPVVVFSKTYCPLCAQTQKTLQDIGVELAVFAVDSDKLRGNRQVAENLLVVLADIAGHSSLPCVFIGGSFVGGSDEIAVLAASGKLRGLVDAAAGQAGAPATMLAMVLQEIKSNPVVVFSKSSETPCTESMHAFTDLSVQPVLFDLDAGDPEVAGQLQAVLLDLTTGRAVPSFFIGGSFVGGNEEVATLAASGKLAQLVHLAI